MNRKKFTMIVKVLYFASTKEITGKSNEFFEIEDGLKVKDLKEKLTSRYASINFERNCIKIAVNKRYCNDDMELKEGDEVALIPPISGG